MPIHIIEHKNPPSKVNPVITGVKDTSLTSSLFRDHLLEVKNDKPKLHFTNYDYTVAGILFLSFILYVWLYASNRKRLGQVIKGFYINRFANQLAREEFSFGNRVSLFLSTLFVLTLTLFISQVNQYYRITFPADNLILFLMIIGFIILMYTVKLIGVKFVGFVFQTPKESGDYIMTIFLFGNTLGLFLLPVVICLAFVKQISPSLFIYCGFGLIAVFFFTRLIRGLIIGFNSIRVSKFYLFLYLCTLEILPFVIMVKLFMLKVK